jgi:diguanylate cyclase (GGDEF)-like protein/PAS domain S-box-containing protein
VATRGADEGSATAAPGSGLRSPAAGLGAVLALLSIVVLAVSPAVIADTTPAARAVGTAAGVLLAVAWAWTRARGGASPVVHGTVVVLVATMSAAWGEPQVLLPVAVVAAVLIGWDLRAHLTAAAFGCAVSAGLLAGAVGELAQPSLLPALLLPPALALGSSWVRSQLGLEASRRALAQLLSAASSRMVQLADPRQLYDEVLRTAQELFSEGPSAAATVVLLDRELRRVVASRDDGHAPPVGHRLADTPAALSEAFDDPGIATLQGDDAAAAFGQLGIVRPLGTVLLAPLTKGEDRLAMLVVEVDRRPDAEVLAALDALADMAGMAIAEAECADELAICDARFRSLVEDSADVIAVMDVQGNVRYVSPSLLPTFGHPPSAVTGTPLWQLLHPDDAHQMPDYLARAATNDRVDASVLLRLRDHVGRWRWAELRARRLHAGCGATCRLHGGALSEVVVNIRDVTDRELLRIELEHQALHDELTGLPNRTLLHDRLVQVLATSDRVGTAAALLYLDLDDFKDVNDSLGHGAGDALLAEFGTRLRSCVRPGDTTARLGGDEFAIVLPVVAGERAAREVAGRVRECLLEPFTVGDLQVRMRVSMGLALSERGDTADELLRRADVAMYLAKEEGGGRIRTHHRGARDSTARLRRIAELQRALERDEITAHFQPIIDLTDTAVVGFEALIRWEHPTRGLVAPGEFIPLAEAVGLVRDLDLFTLRAACQHLRRWQLIMDGTDGPALSMNVNLSGLSVMQPRMVGDVAAVLDESGVAPAHLVLEVTEGVLLHDVQGAIDQLVALKALGVRLAVDDFGVGYSSLAYLQQFPVDVLKIDRSFVDTVDGPSREGAVARSIVDLARELDLLLIAEGIERPTQVAALRDLACPLGQGFHLARPMAAAAVEAGLRAGPHGAAATRP